MNKKERPMFVQEFPHAVHDFYKPLSSAHAVEHYDWGPSLTRQEFAEECDINTLMRRFEYQVPPWLQPTAADYVDWLDVPDNLMDTLEQLNSAQQSFMRLPATVRRQFDNDAVAFVDFAADPNNLDQLRSWGLAPPAPPKPQEVVRPPEADLAPSAPKAPAGASRPA